MNDQQQTERCMTRVRAVVQFERRDGAERQEAFDQIRSGLSKLAASFDEHQVDDDQIFDIPLRFTINADTTPEDVLAEIRSSVRWELEDVVGVYATLAFVDFPLDTVPAGSGLRPKAIDQLTGLTAY